MRKRKTAEDECIHHRELRGHSADAEGEHGHSQDAEGLFFDQHAQANADVLKERFEKHKGEVVG